MDLFDVNLDLCKSKTKEDLENAIKGCAKLIKIYENELVSLDYLSELEQARKQLELIELENFIDEYKELIEIIRKEYEYAKLNKTLFFFMNN